MSRSTASRAGTWSHRAKRPRRQRHRHAPHGRHRARVPHQAGPRLIAPRAVTASPAVQPGELVEGRLLEVAVLGRGELGEGRLTASGASACRALIAGPSLSTGDWNSSRRGAAGRGRGGALGLVPQLAEVVGGVPAGRDVLVGQRLHQQPHAAGRARGLHPWLRALGGSGLLRLGFSTLVLHPGEAVEGPPLTGGSWTRRAVRAGSMASGASVLRAWIAAFLSQSRLKFFSSRSSRTQGGGALALSPSSPRWTAASRRVETSLSDSPPPAASPGREVGLPLHRSRCALGHRPSP